MLTVFKTKPCGKGGIGIETDVYDQTIGTSCVALYAGDTYKQLRSLVATIARQQPASCNGRGGKSNDVDQ
eukprot:m.7327 g.7327  ORF g.7327 m.7327 type:complete len:70 (+) comp18402_c0_seq1:479-688(+)